MTYNKEKFLAFAKFDAYINSMVNESPHLEAIFNSTVLDDEFVLHEYQNFIGPNVNVNDATNALLNLLKLQKFNDWFNKGNFDKWIKDNSIHKTQILYELNQMFQKELSKISNQ